MNDIQNRAFVQYLEDGSQLHYELRSTKSLNQALSMGHCIPDWTIAANQPIIWLSLQNGSTPIAPDSDNQVWTYNGNVITFDSNNRSTNSEFVGVFEKTTYSVGALSMPALKIINNLATLSDIVDIDVIGFSGKKTLSANPISFGCAISVQITELIKGGYVGTLEFLDGKANIDTEDGTVTLISKFYSQTGEEITTGFTRKWYLNDVQVTSTTVSTTAAYLTNGGARMVVPEKAVTDYAVAKCEFYNSVNGVETLRYTCYAGIDDTQDPEYMWIRNALNAGGQATGNAASLRNGDYVTFQSYMSRSDSPNSIDARWVKYYVKLLDAEKSIIYSNIAGVPEAHVGGDYDGYRDITTEVSASQSPTGSVAVLGQVAIPYSTKSVAKNGMTLLFLAATEAKW